MSIRSRVPPPRSLARPPESSSGRRGTPTAFAAYRALLFARVGWEAGERRGKAWRRERPAMARYRQRWIGSRAVSTVAVVAVTPLRLAGLPPPGAPPGAPVPGTPPGAVP